MFLLSSRGLAADPASQLDVLREDRYALCVAAQAGHSR